MKGNRISVATGYEAAGLEILKTAELCALCALHGNGHGLALFPKENEFLDVSLLGNSPTR